MMRQAFVALALVATLLASQSCIGVSRLRVQGAPLLWTSLLLRASVVRAAVPQRKLLLRGAVQQLSVWDIVRQPPVLLLMAFAKPRLNQRWLIPSNRLLSPVMLPRSCQSLDGQITAVPSRLPVNTCRPSGENATLVTSCV
jgi:hypothetical protein